MSQFMRLLAVVLPTAVFFFLLQVSHTAAPAVAHTSDLTAVYVLAFDNDPASSVDLSQQYTTTVQSIVAATADGQRTAVILADRNGPADTHILLASGGVLTPVAGLPDGTGNLTTAVDELNTADGTALGHFLVWALQTYPAPRTLVSYVGHGAPFAPETDIATALGLDNNNGDIPDPNPDDALLPPLPIHVDVNAALTDHTSRDLISPHDLAVALQAVASAGLPPITVLDLVHCFSGTIEQLYEISRVTNGTGAPIATTLTASPNYTFFAPTMLGAALAELSLTQTAQNTAVSLITSYDAHLSTYDEADSDVPHPRQLIAIDSEFVPAIKEAWDQVAFHLLQDFPTAEQAVTAVYASATVDKYDTTFCQPLDYELAPPDALVDMTRFARELGLQYAPSHPVAMWSGQTVARLNTAVLEVIMRNGQPWFAPQAPPPVWNFDETQGIALYADFVGMSLPPETSRALIWQSHWYTDTQFAGPTGNPHPYAFVQGGYDGAQWQPTGTGQNWADFMARWWGETLDGDTEALATSACIPEFPLVRQGQLFLPAIIQTTFR